jgi:hypothetical protein
MISRVLSFAAVVLACAASTAGCLGTIRDTTTPRSATEELLVSTAAERAIAQFDNVEKELKGKRVAIDDHLFNIGQGGAQDQDKGYALSAARHFVSEHGGILLAKVEGEKGKDDAGKEIDVKPERILEIRNGALGIDDKSWGFGIPALPFPIYGTNLTTMTPALYLFFKGKQEGWAKFQFWIYDPRQEAYVAKSKDLWGKTYYTKYWFFGIGPFDFSNDIYPDESLFENLK